MSHNHNHNHQHASASGCCCHSHKHHDESRKGSFLSGWGIELAVGLLFVCALLLQYCGVIRSEGALAVAYLLAALPAFVTVGRDGWRLWRRGDVMNEVTLMLVAAAGAWLLGEFPESVAVLLLFCIGEKLEDTVGDKVRDRVRALVGRMPEKAVVIGADGTRRDMAPADVAPGQEIAVAPGQRVPLDGVLLASGGLEFDTSAITGESLPRHIAAEADVLSGMIPLGAEARIRVTRPYSDSSMTRILAMVEEAAASKSPAEKMLRRISRWYTPVVFLLALAVVAVPFLISLFPGAAPFEAAVWLRRSLVFLVCSCPCALIISIPLSYFMAIGLAARRGILFKGSRYLDIMRKVKAIMLDKTGTITTGRFSVAHIATAPGVAAESVLAAAAAADTGSAHPLAAAICRAAENMHLPEVADVRTVPHGLGGTLAGEDLLLGSLRLMEARGVDTTPVDVTGVAAAGKTAVWLAVGGKVRGALFLCDTPKSDSAAAVADMHRLGIEEVTVLSGDVADAVAPVAAVTGADAWRGGLLPAEKRDAVAESVAAGRVTAFVGDGINDAPALAAADAGIAMGTAGTGLAVESAGIVIVGDSLAKIGEARRLSRKVNRVVIENVVFAFGVKLAVMALGACGIATLWAAVFADTGVTLCTVLWTILRLSGKSTE